MYANKHAYLTRFAFFFIKYTFTPSITVPQITCHIMLCPLSVSDLFSNTIAYKTWYEITMTYSTHKRFWHSFLLLYMIENFLSLQHPFNIISRRIPFIIINDFLIQTKINRTFEENHPNVLIFSDDM